MNFSGFGTWVKENYTLRVIMLELDKRLPLKLYVIFVVGMFTLLAVMGAQYTYFDCRTTKGLGCCDSLMYSGAVFIALMLLIIIVMAIIYGISVVGGSWLDGYFASRRLKKSIAEEKSDIQQEFPPIDQKLLSQYLSAKFKGMGANENYVPQLLKDLENLRKTSPTEVQRFAVMLYESKVMVNKPAQFNEWVKIFFNIVGMESPKYISRRKHKPTLEMIERYYYIPPLPKKGENTPL